MTDSKIFVVSLHKCMTRSTDMLLSMLGFSTVHFPKFFRGENLMESVRLRPDEQEAHYLLARNLLSTGDTAAAEPDQPKPYALASEILVRSGRVPEARAMARRAVEHRLYRRRLFHQAAAGALRSGEPGAACRLWSRGVRRS